jgi:hypothetical protein
MFTRLAVLIAVCVAMLPGCSKPGDPADIVGSWVIDAKSIDNAAYNAARKAANRSKRELTAADIDPMVRDLAAKLRAAPTIYTFASDGTFEAGNGDDTLTVTGTWTYAGSVLTAESDASDKPLRFQFEPGSLVNIKSDASLRTITLVRKP